MSEYVYKLNLPSIRDILLPGKYEELFVATDEPHLMFNLDPKTYLNTEHRLFNNYEWEESILFYKADGLVGMIHTDTDTVWAINYIVGGVGEMLYYDPVRLGAPRNLVDPAGNERPVYRYPAQKNPDKKYIMSEGVYLVRTDMPHLPIGHGKRYSLSIRATAAQKIQPWAATVERFKQYIV